ncbi:hypothetical protein B0A55_08592 [Friedmanniomyces simplex]|uniref:Uncharacterized protein n=1 Tax=Friedmanniomyces simplex TaxID=329884 RepID=A0A4U0WNV9_9PEZI|nr:hypothetical protein B0A55_08592 [Friedmanniomyces simplex]
MCINCYNTCKTLKAGIAWATPVRPDELVAHLEAYTKVLPVIRTLRLAQRFGQGPRAYITKLPLEIEQAVEDLIIRSEWMAWSARISQAKNGAFHKYDVIMRKHFGLEVYFADTTVDERKADRWPKNKNDHWNGADERKTTLCYLTLPNRLGPLSSFCPSDMAAELGGPEIKAAQVIDIDMDALTITDEQSRRFHRTLKTLGLEPYLHPSQAHRVTVSANVSQGQPKAKTEKRLGGEGETEKRANSDWPRLLLLVKSMAVPVRPDELGDRMDRFTQTLPQLHALRLCHRFGEGPDVHITKLPVEVVEAIEELVTEAWSSFDARNWQMLGGWSEQFACFEHRCAPMDHLPDCHSPLSDYDGDEFQPCQECEEDWYNDACKNVCTKQTAEPCMHCKGTRERQSMEDCRKSCRSEKTHLMNENVMGLGWGWVEKHDEVKDAWMKRIDPKKEGAFAEHAKALRKHFGLQVVTQNTRIATEDKSSWPKHPDNEWHEDKEPEKTYGLTNMEDEYSFARMAVAQAVAVQLPDSAEIPKIQARFQHALRVLGLRPWLHPAMGAIADVKRTKTKKRVEKGSKQVKKPSRWARYDVKSQWPRILLLVAGRFEMEDRY